MRWRTFHWGLLLAVCASTALFAAPVQPAIDTLRKMVETRPADAIRVIHQHLDAGALAADDERELLWYLGQAAIQAGDDAAFAETSLRLGSLAVSRNDLESAPYADLLRAKRLLRRGQRGDGIKTALRAATALQLVNDPRVQARVLYELCDDYAIAEDRARTLPTCRKAMDAWRAVGDDFELARAEQVTGFEYFNLGDLAAAERLLRQTRQRFLDLGDKAMAGSVGDDLSRVLLASGAGKESLELSRQSLQRELHDGDARNAMLSRGNVARALALLGKPLQAMDELASAIETARRLQAHGALSELLVTQAEMAARQGNDGLAVRDYAEAVTLINLARASEQAGTVAEIESRYARRESALRIRQLQSQTHEQALALASAHIKAEQQDAQASRQRMLALVAAAASIVLTIIIVFLLVLWRRQRRHAQALRELSRHDVLTGLENRRACLERLSRLAAQAPRPAAHQHGLLMLDLDHFKRINDTGGHPFGDTVLHSVAQALEAGVGALGYVARIGGEEFAVICPALGVAECLRLAELLRAKVKVLPVDLADGGIELGVSIGVAMFDGQRCHDVSSWMASADQALYTAKAHGRNRVVASSAAR
ncbi:MAG TPA: GGDEF domain-containing protein [Rhodanobacteraceae bacterium]|nr:GGDEF domain-containing protein [Rhodanobacteraceae bacterium]